PSSSRPASRLSGRLRAAFLFSVRGARNAARVRGEARVPRCRVSEAIFFAGREVPPLGDAPVGQPLLAVEGGHASGSGRGDRLAIDVIDDVPTREDALDVRHGRVVMRKTNVAT